MHLSVLDLAFIREGGTAAEALANSLDLARHVEAWGYKRFWLAEHHNMTGIASAATSVVIGHIAAGTRTIRVGAGGIMLPNHAPMIIAEQFGTLETLYPGRIDLGLGRAPGTDQATLRALRRSYESAESFPQDVYELQALLAPAGPGQTIRAVPGVGTNVPLWILGSSLFGAKLAAVLGLPYAFASHFAPDALEQALSVYRSEFQPSEQLSKPHAMVAVNVVAADTDAEGVRLATSLQQRFTDMFRGTRGLLPPPIDDIDTYWSAAEKARVSSMMRCSFIGSRDTVASGLEEFNARLQPDELIVASAIFDHAARLRSYEILGEIARQD
ncbi:LLM class flavin-dependent oxidoreductase [Breoghania sp. L-A4]|uniref:LLM class flavin-dependent oxidoreductase n=1 Tax=Breoghania sp. L-A4 TaxID=2304600 RepID=UPI000E359B72|nr:LLM class flavin-dependent oxidoreductase [Breoghania sp. L-A4]AXS39183.1 LLM class flavin-dependent oxidoreductase [Breoghania sp. L-A4]